MIIGSSLSIISS